MMRLRSLLRALAAASILFLALPLRSAGQDNDSRATLVNLLTELKQSYEDALASDSLLVDNHDRREQLAEMVKAADEVTLMLYTQDQKFAFDMAFALEKVAGVYDSFKVQTRLSDKYLIASRQGLRRYNLLGETLRDMYLNHAVDSVMQADSLLLEMPPTVPLEEVDPEKKALLDSCLFYSDALSALYGESVLMALQDSVYFAETDRRLRQAYDYVQANYAETQKNIFMGGSVNIVEIIKNWKPFLAKVRKDLAIRFGDTVSEGDTEGRESHPWGGTNSLRHGALSLLALLLSFLVASLITGLVLKLVRSEEIKALKPILASILAIFLFVLVMVIFSSDRSSSYWKMGYRLLSQFFWLTLAIFFSLLIRVKASQAKASRNLYVPTLLLAFLTILLRAMFLPASLVPLILPPALVLFILWQSGLNVRYRTRADRTDLRYAWASVAVMTLSCLLSLAGYPMVGVLLLTFWTFQLALLHTITAIYHLVKRNYDNRIIQRKAKYHEENPNMPLDDKNAYIEVTWFHDLLRMVIFPIAILLSFLLSVQLTTRAYQLSLTGANILTQPIFRHPSLQHLTLSNLLIVVTLFFLFRYLIYMVKALSRVIKLRGIIEKKGAMAMPLKESDVNLSLPNVLYSLIGWLIFLIIVFTILHMPTKAITAITTGLAAGVGFALKDLINNFFYGVQLMAGRIRVGDKIACDGVRGIVKRVSYQTTQVEDEDGSLIAFTNTDLFTKKFRNLNSGRNYELLKIPVTVRYGTDIEKTRQVILEALKPLMVEDKYGRSVVDPSFPIDVRFDNFGESSINIFVVLYTTVDTHYTFPARAKEAIYNAFHENGIEIPFPQRDVYVKSVPETKKG
jgi:small-conductance mechanosensitive channel